MNKRKQNHSVHSAFTLIELLAVIAIIGILAAILFPVIGKIRESAAETAVKAQFSQWTQAFELFRQDYGFYPAFGTDGDDLYVNKTGNVATPSYDGSEFYQTLTGRVLDTGDRVVAGDPGFVAGNIRAASFYTFGEGEVEKVGTNAVIRDKTGNGDIVVLFDLNQDGIIELSGGNNPDYSSISATSLPPVLSTKTGKSFQLTFPADGVRAGVIFYSAGHGNRPVTSW